MSHWIESRRFDLCYFILSFLAGPLFYVGFVFWRLGSWGKIGEEDAVLFFVLFTAIFDAPHIFHTFYRTHGDGVEFKRSPLKQSAILVGAMIVVFTFDYFGQSTKFLAFLGVYGSWHILKQNIGLTKLYSSLSKESPQMKKLRAGALFWVFLFFILNEKNSVKELLPTLNHIPYLFQILWGVGLLGFLFSLFRIIRLDRKMFYPVQIFFYSVILYFTFLSFVHVPLLVIIALGTIAHNIQYQAWMWLYESRHSKVNFVPYIWLFGTILAGVFLTLPYEGGNIVLTEDWISTGYNGLVLWHYFIDGEIWHFTSMPELSIMTKTNS